MSNIRHIFRLHTQGVGNFEIIKQTGIMRGTLKKYISDFKKSGLTFTDVNELTDKDLEELFTKPEPKRADIRLQNLISIFPVMEKKQQKTGISRMAYWKEYIIANPDGYEYSRFNRYYAQWKSNAIPVMRIEHKAGDKMFIDFAGEKLAFFNKNTGSLIYTEVFVAILGASQFTYVEATLTQKKEDFITACENALHFYGGVAGAIVCDNLRSAVTKSNRYEPSINETFADFAEHYNTAIIPTRVCKPKDKALVEGTINIIYSRIYSKVKDKRVYSLEELNKAIKVALEEHNSHELTGKDISRTQQFQDFERSALLPLPALKYEFKKQAHVTVPKNGHISLSEDKHFYSVPYQFIRKHVKVLYSNVAVEIFYHYECIASHKRDRASFTYTTNNEHLLPAHRYTAELASERFIRQAEEIHLDVKKYITEVLNGPRHKELSYRICTGILGFAQKVGKIRLTKACRQATYCGLYNYRIIKKILDQNLDQFEDEIEQLKMPEHNNIRGKDYYQ